MTSFGLVLWAEVRKLLSRPVARMALVLSCAIALFGPAALWWLSSSSATINDQSAASVFDVCAANGLRWAMVVRAFLPAQVLIAVLASVSLAGERQANTLRDDLVRPVARWQVLAAKWLALCTWSAISLVAQIVLGGALGALLLGLEGEARWSSILLAHAMMWCAEASVAAVGLAAAAMLRSVAGSVLGLVLFLLFERAASWIGAGLASFWSAFGEKPAVLDLLPLMPTSAWSGWWEIANGQTPEVAPEVALVGWTLIAAGIALARFSRADL